MYFGAQNKQANFNYHSSEKVRYRQGQYFLAGLEFGMDVTEATIDNGTQMGDFNGYKLTFTGMERIPANHLNCSTEAGLATLFSSATVVTS